MSPPKQLDPPKQTPDKPEQNSDDEDFPDEESRIVIRSDGTVVIENLTETLAEVAVALNPEDIDLSCRLDLDGSGDSSATGEGD